MTWFDQLTAFFISGGNIAWIISLILALWCRRWGTVGFQISLGLPLLILIWISVETPGMSAFGWALILCYFVSPLLGWVFLLVGLWRLYGKSKRPVVTVDGHPVRSIVCGDVTIYTSALSADDLVRLVQTHQHQTPLAVTLIDGRQKVYPASGWPSFTFEQGQPEKYSRE